MRIPVITIIALFIISILTDWYIWRDVKRYISPSGKKKWPKVYALTSLACWIYLTVVLCLPRRQEDSGIVTVMWMLYAYLSVYAGKIIYILFSVAGKIFSKITRRTYNYLAGAGLVAGVLTCAFFWVSAIITPRIISVSNVEIDSPSLPSNFNDFTIAQISDLHVGTWGSDTTLVAQLVDSINSLRPDVIFFTGDIVSRTSEELTPFVPVLGRLRAPFGVYSVLGNHDYGDYIDWPSPQDRAANNQRLAADIRRMGWRQLDNDYDFIVLGGDSIVVIGVENWGEPPFKSYGDLRKAYPDSNGHGLYDNRFKILLTHNPEHWRQKATAQSNIDLTLSGHTHAMQMMIGSGSHKWSPAALRYKNWAGLFTQPSSDGRPMHLYVNIGSGEVGMPARFGTAYPEITLITLKQTPQAVSNTLSN